MIKQFSSLEIILLSLVAIGGALILFVPMQYLFFAFLGAIILMYLILSPKISFYLMLFLSPWSTGFVGEFSSLPFNQCDIFIFITFLGIMLKILFGKWSTVNISTRIDKWLVVLLILNFIEGVVSISHRGYQGFLRYSELVTIFYMSVYFIRTKNIKFSEILNCMLFIGLFQASWGILQSLTGSLGANFHSDRGYFGYIGLGSSSVWHGRGGFEHFNQLGPFLSCLFLFFLPINYFLSKNKKKGYIILSILLLGIINTYSRGSLMALIASLILFLYQIQKDKAKFLFKVIPIGAIIFGISNFLKSTSYVTTLAPRNLMWQLAFNAINQNTRSRLFGTGLKSYEDAVFPFLPANVSSAEFGNYFAHNFFIANIVEVGYVGLSIILSFLLYVLISAYIGFKNSTKLVKYLNLSIGLIFFTIFFEGMFDHAFNQFSLQIWLYLFLGILYGYSKQKSRGEIWSS